MIEEQERRSKRPKLKKGRGQMSANTSNSSKKKSTRLNKPEDADGYEVGALCFILLFSLLFNQYKY